MLLRGHSDTGKTTAMIEAAVSAQKRNILPVFIITEMKWSWDHARMMGMDVEEIVDEKTGESTELKKKIKEFLNPRDAYSILRNMNDDDCYCLGFNPKILDISKNNPKVEAYFS